MDIKIDEGSHRAAPTFFQIIIHTVSAAFMGVIFLQVLFFALTPLAIDGSIVLYLTHPLFITYVVCCALMGWFFGEHFIGFLSDKSSDWWDLWGHFR